MVRPFFGVLGLSKLVPRAAALNIYYTPRRRIYIKEQDMRVDLHMHSNASDGALSPAEVMRLASSCGCGIVSLTDHDTFGGSMQAAKTAGELGMKYISGVEISSLYADKTIHIVGLGLDFESPSVLGFFSESGPKREARARIMDERFREFGIEGALEGALKFAGGIETLSRTHFARFLVEAGHVAKYEDAFSKYLKDGGPCHVPTKWPAVADVVEFIRTHGGVPVLAHPGRYKFQSPWMIEELIRHFKESGGDAIEVSSGSQPRSTNEYFADAARRLELLASTGSDFHAPGSIRPNPGMQDQVPADLTGVWTLF